MIIERNARDSSQFQHLLELWPFKSCVGIPIPATEEDQRCALFLFHPAFDGFTPAQISQIQAAVYLVAAILRENRLAQLIQTSQRYLFMGQIAASMLHELNNKSNALETNVRLLDLDFQELMEEPGSISHQVRSEHWAANGKYLCRK